MRLIHRLSTAFLFAGIVACTLTQSFTSLTDGVCPAGEKACNNACVAPGDPATGCGTEGCTPCGTTNTDGVACSDNACALSCTAGFGSCDGDPFNGCETNLNADPNNCLSCGRKCEGPNAVYACTNGTCAITNCDPGFADCNKGAPDGCEANLGSDSNNCGACGNVCPLGRQCVGGACQSVIQVASNGSSNHACAVLSTGTAMCWGNNNAGQLGNATTCAGTCGSATAVTVSALTAVKQVATGGQHSCAVKTNGAVLCWGSNQYGQLGTGDTTNKNTATPVSGLTAGVSAVALGANHSCAFLTNGGVKCWGRGANGQLGIAPPGATSNNALTPGDVPGVSNVTGLAAGGDSTCVNAGGQIKCWGDNELGQISNGGATTNPCLDSGGVTSCTYSPINASNGNNATNVISVGTNFSCWNRAAPSAGTVCVGNAGQGQLGSMLEAGTSTGVPQAVPSVPTTVANMASGSGATCLVRSGAADLWCWGNNTKGELFTSTLSPPYVAPTLIDPGNVGAVAGIAQVTSGNGFTCFIASQGVYCLGNNTNAQLGNGSGLDSAVHSTPNLVVGLPR